MSFPRLKTYVKDPDEKLDYSVDWSAYLQAKQDTIASSSWIVPGGIGNSAPSNDIYGATIWLDGGTHGQDYIVVNRITTIQGRIEEASIVVAVRSSAS